MLRAGADMLLSFNENDLPSSTIMLASSIMVRRVGNWFYRNAFGIYRPTYAIYKAYQDRAERRFLAGTIQAGDIVVDAGANIGMYSRFLAKCVGPTGMVHSFEPHPENFARLRSAVSNSVNIQLNQLAVGNITSQSTLYISEALNVDHRVYPTEGDARRPLSIKCIALDDYFPPGQRVDFIKMDIQGYEFHALSGADRVIRENRRLKLLFEFWPYGLRQAGASWKELVVLLQRHDLSIKQISDNGITRLRPESISEEPDWYINLLAERA
jgi:FkbM family methyltransferase